MAPASTALARLAGLVLLCSAAFACRALEPAEARAPALPTGERPCQVGAAEAGPRALAVEARANAKLERYPFAPQDGWAALLLLAEAADCSAQAREHALRERVLGRAASLRRRIESDYRNHLIRYRRAHAQRDVATQREQLLREVMYLRALLASASGEFTLQLDREQRELESGSVSSGVVR